MQIKIPGHWREDADEGPPEGSRLDTNNTYLSVGFFGSLLRTVGLKFSIFWLLKFVFKSAREVSR